MTTNTTPTILTDQKNGSLGITPCSGGLCITVLTEGEGHAAGPFTRAQIAAALDAVAPDGDGREVREPTAADFERADFARHPDGRIAARIFPGHIYPWAGGNEIGYDRWTDLDMADDGWVPVAEEDPTPLPPIAAYWMHKYDRRHGDAKRWKETARRAINNYRAASAHLSMLRDGLNSAIRALEEARDERDEARASLREWQERAGAAESSARTLARDLEEAQAEAREAAELRTGSAVTDEMVERVKDRMRERGMGYLSHYSIRGLLTAAFPESRPLTAHEEARREREATQAPTVSAITAAQWRRGYDTLRQFIARGNPVESSEPVQQGAVVEVVKAVLTEPPARPDGAEEIEVVLSKSPLDPEPVRRELADFLAAHSVRVTTRDGEER